MRRKRANPLRAGALCQHSVIGGAWDFAAGTAGTGQRILDRRKERGAFSAVNELDAVDGIGARLMESFKDLVTVQGRMGWMAYKFVGLPFN